MKKRNTRDGIPDGFSSALISALVSMTARSAFIRQQCVEIFLGQPCLPGLLSRTIHRV